MRTIVAYKFSQELEAIRAQIPWLTTKREQQLLHKKTGMLALMFLLESR